MNAVTRNSKEAFVRVVQLLEENSILLPTAATPLLAQLKLKITELDTLGGNQREGTGTSRSGVVLRREAARALRNALIDIAETARVLDQTTHEGLAARVTMGKRLNYQALRDRAAAVILALKPIKVAFTARGYDPGFLDELSALSTALSTATERKFRGLNGQVQSTATLIATARKGVQIMRDLQAMLKPILRKLDPGLLAALKAAGHVRSRPQPKEQQPSPTPGTPARPTVTSAASVMPRTATATSAAVMP